MLKAFAQSCRLRKEKITQVSQKIEKQQAAINALLNSIKNKKYRVYGSYAVSVISSSAALSGGLLAVYNEDLQKLTDALKKKNDELDSQNESLESAKQSLEDLKETYPHC